MRRKAEEQEFQAKIENNKNESDSADKSDPNFIPEEDEEIELFSQKVFNNLIKELRPSQRKSEFLVSKFKGANLTATGFKICGNRNRNNISRFDECFTTDARKGITFCHNIKQSFDYFGHEYEPSE